MNILITGANGFIGKHLRFHLEAQHEIFTISRGSGTELLTDNDYEVDLSDVSLVKELFEVNIFKKKIDLIIHCAAVLSTTDNTDISVFHRNIAITESMIYIARIVESVKFINLSSIGVYPNRDGTYNEGAAIEPSINHECLYSLSKFCSEEVLKFYLKDSHKVINLRLGQVYGEGMRKDRIFSIMKDELLKENVITVFGNGSRISNFLSIDYFIKKIKQIMLNDKIAGTYNLGEKNMSYFDLANMVIKEFGNSYSKIIMKEMGVKSKVIVDSSKINNLLEE